MIHGLPRFDGAELVHARSCSSAGWGCVQDRGSLPRRRGLRGRWTGRVAHAAAEVPVGGTDHGLACGRHAEVVAHARAAPRHAQHRACAMSVSTWPALSAACRTSSEAGTTIRRTPGATRRTRPLGPRRTRGKSQVLEPAVRARPDERLVHRLAGRGDSGAHGRRAVRQGHGRLDRMEVHEMAPDVSGVVIGIQRPGSQRVPVRFGKVALPAHQPGRQPVKNRAVRLERISRPTLPAGSGGPSGSPH